MVDCGEVEYYADDEGGGRFVVVGEVLRGERLRGEVGK